MASRLSKTDGERLMHHTECGTAERTKVLRKTTQTDENVCRDTKTSSVVTCGFSCLGGAPGTGAPVG